ncbi:hypothetical protein ANCCAN_12963 [Ancylostoma caninum]|uniref:Uncharacterized protein n=1 Tax=Ancylostoma caninum TaxID=29170 RepID=A0A368GDI1_ANCCA|nr:hypothetical protein ANCCAN_12963 [Ancylostoma caninum]
MMGYLALCTLYHLLSKYQNLDFNFIPEICGQNGSRVVLAGFLHAAEKAAERFEAQTIELSNKVEDLNRHVNDLAQQRQRLQAENNDLLKEVHDQKVQLDNLQHVKYTLAQQLEEARRRLEDAERVSSLADVMCAVADIW